MGTFRAEMSLLANLEHIESMILAVLGKSCVTAECVLNAHACRPWSEPITSPHIQWRDDSRA